MDTLEKRALLSNNLIGFFVRYVDDIFCLTTNQQSAEEFKEIMDSQHPSIRFEIEHPQERKKLALLVLRKTSLYTTRPH
jgi:hypothetical protein